jgi:hypothetical protein
VENVSRLKTTGPIKSLLILNLDHNNNNMGSIFCCAKNEDEMKLQTLNYVPKFSTYKEINFDYFDRNSHKEIILIEFSNCKLLY